MMLKGQKEMLPTKNLLSEHWEFMGISKKTKTNFAELKSMAQEIIIRILVYVLQYVVQLYHHS